MPGILPGIYELSVTPGSRASLFEGAWCSIKEGTLKTDTPDNLKTNLPNSDETARPKHPYAEEDIEDASDHIEGLETSNKSGKHSSVEKLSASRPEFGVGSAGKPVPGAFGSDESHGVTGRNAGPGTNQYRCNACGRYFNTATELSTHEPECRLAKASTDAGRTNLQQQDAETHAPNDAESKEKPFQHGTRTAE